MHATNFSGEVMSVHLVPHGGVPYRQDAFGDLISAVLLSILVFLVFFVLAA
jgi:hypothetical protein